MLEIGDIVEILRDEEEDFEGEEGVVVDIVSDPQGTRVQVKLSDVGKPRLRWFPEADVREVK